MRTTYVIRQELKRASAAVGFLVRRVSGFAIRLSRIGVSYHDTSRDARSVVLLNWFCLLVLASDVATMPQYVRMNMTTHTVFLSATMLCYVTAMWLNHRKFYKAARHLFSFVANLSVGFFSFTFGLETGVQMLYFVTPILVFLIYPRQARVARAVWIIVPVVAMALTTIWRAPIEPYFKRVPFTPEELRIQWISAYTWTFIFLLSLARHFDTMAKIREKELAEALDRQWVAYGMVVHDVSAYLANASYAGFLLEKDDLDTQQRYEVAKVLSGDLNRLHQLITILRNQLSHQPSLPVGPDRVFNLGEAFDEAVSLFKIRRTMSASCLFVASDAASQLMLNMKRDEMIQIIDNLINNASRAASQTKCEGLVFLMEVNPVEPGSDGPVTLAFSDNGPGVSPDLLSKILSGETDAGTKQSSAKPRKSVGLRLISNFLSILGGRLHYKTPAEGPLVSRQKAEGTWGHLPGTTFLLDLPSSMIVNTRGTSGDRAPHLRKPA